MRLVLLLSNLIGHASLKCHVKSDTNIIDSFVVIVKQKKIPSFFLHMEALRCKGYFTYGIRARVIALRPIWVQHVVRMHEDGYL